MNPERWQRVKSALSDAMSLSGAVRAAYLERLGSTDPELREELESLLSAEQEAGSHFLEHPAAADLGLAPPTEQIGRRLGPYELLELIGTGGMGEVYRAIRADREYEKQVAIKLVRAGTDVRFVGERLRTERQILAAFEHPNIARLLDGGTTAEGVPYLVMELIDGRPITLYCDEQQLDVGARLELFLRVCSAVQYAHQRMVIHRDLKPSNILVTADGQPKLLDFGIAKILERGAIPVQPDATINALRILTPEYASPEQLSGEAVSAASDVYALGVILFELLTGVRPFSGDRVTRDVVKAVLDPSVKRPSTVVRQLRQSRPGDRHTAARAVKLSRRLRGDLDNIILMALRKEPDRRYGSVEQLADDIRRHLEHQPVIARKPTFGYRISTFVARYKLTVAATLLIIAVLIGGIIVSAHEAHVAQVQRARAERRFNDVRKLADALIFDIHDSIRDLPGAERSRRLVINTALHYLDGLSREAAGDRSLQRELAAGYVRLGDLQGRAHEANVGDYAGARESYQRAFALLQASLAGDPNDETAQHDIIVTCGKLSDLLWFTGDPAGALSYSRQTVTRSRRLAEGSPDNPRFQYLLATSLTDHGYKLFKIRGDTASAMDEMRRSIAMLEGLAASSPKDHWTARTLALAYGRLAEMLASRHDGPEALSQDEKAYHVLANLARAAPHNADFAHLQAFAEHDIAGVLTDMGRLDDATQHEQTALSSFRSLAAADPKIPEYHSDVGQALTSVADILGRRGQFQNAIEVLRQALAAMDAAPSRDTSDASFRLMRARAESLLGDDYSALASGKHGDRAERSSDWQTARGWYERAMAVYRQLSGAWFEAAEQARKTEGSIRRCDEALSNRRHPP